MTDQDRSASVASATKGYRLAWPFFVKATVMRRKRPSKSGLTQDDLLRIFEDDLRASNDWPHQRAQRGACPRHA